MKKVRQRLSVICQKLKQQFWVQVRFVDLNKFPCSTSPQSEERTQNRMMVRGWLQVTEHCESFKCAMKVRAFAFWLPLGSRHGKEHFYKAHQRITVLFFGLVSIGNYVAKPWLRSWPLCHRAPVPSYVQKSVPHEALLLFRGQHLWCTPMAPRLHELCYHTAIHFKAQRVLESISLIH